MSFSISSKKRTKKSYHRSYYQDKNRISNRFFGGFSKLVFCLVAMTMLTSRHLLFGRTPSTQVLVSAFVARTPCNFNQRRQQQQLQQNLLPLDSSNIIVANKNHRCFVSSTINYARSQDVDVDDEIGDTSSYSKTITGYKLPKITWYPGHIARAERQLSEILKSVDVLIEVRDGRAPKATAHPMVGQWAAGKPRIVVLTHCDAVPSPSIVAWQKAYDDYGAGRWDESSVDKQVKHTAQQRRRENKILDPKYDNDDDILQKVESVIYVNAKVGKGIPALIRTIHKAGTYVHERRARRELNPRSLRVGVLGFPNVGKSTLINKLLGGKKRAKTANTPGVTRSLQWIRVGFKYQSHLATNNNDKSFELLDSPGIIPSSIPNQRDALLLAACNSIGDASYDNQAVAAHLCEWVKSLHLMGKAHLTVPKWREICKKRYAGFDPLHPRKYHDGNNGEMITRLPTGEDFLHYVADNTSCNGDLENAARKILQDFRSGRWGPAALQLAPESREDEGEADVVIQDLRNIMQNDEEVDMITSNIDYNEVTQERAEQAVKTAKELGLELPPMVSSTDNDDEDENESASVKDSEVGKGLFDGW